jgi:hypothetical protein
MESLAMFAVYGGKKSTSWRCGASVQDLAAFYQRELALVDKERKATSVDAPPLYENYKDKPLSEYRRALDSHLKQLQDKDLERLLQKQDMWLPKVCSVGEEQRRLGLFGMRAMLLRRCLAVPLRAQTNRHLQRRWEAQGWTLPDWDNTILEEPEELHTFWLDLEGPYPGDRPFDHAILGFAGTTSSSSSSCSGAAEFQLQAQGQSGYQPPRASEKMPALSDVGVRGLRTAVATSGLKVILWTYYALPNVPAGVEVRSACSLLSAVKAKALLLNNEHVAHLADIVRFRGMARSPAKFTWFADVESLWAKHIRFVLSKLPAMAMGHFVGSALGRASLMGHTTMEFEMVHCRRYSGKPRDGLGAQPPLRLPHGSPVFVDVEQLEKKFFPLLMRPDHNILHFVGCPEFRGPGGRPDARWGRSPVDKSWYVGGVRCQGEPHSQAAQTATSRPSKVHYQVFMDCLDLAVQNHGLEYAVADWPVVAPLHFWQKSRPIQALGGYQPAAELIQHSLAVTCFWSTSKFLDQGDQTVSQLGSHSRIQSGSAWEKISTILAPVSESAPAVVHQVKRRLPAKTQILVRKRPVLVQQTGLCTERYDPGVEWEAGVPWATYWKGNKRVKIMQEFNVATQRDFP